MIYVFAKKGQGHRSTHPIHEVTFSSRETQAEKRKGQVWLHEEIRKAARPGYSTMNFKLLVSQPSSGTR